MRPIHAKHARAFRLKATQHTTIYASCYTRGERAMTQESTGLWPMCSATSKWEARIWRCNANGMNSTLRSMPFVSTPATTLQVEREAYQGRYQTGRPGVGL